MTDLVIGAATHRGLVRRDNQDSHLVDRAAGIAAVADGMGGHAAGEVASRIAIESVHQAWTGAHTRRAAAAAAAAAAASDGDGDGDAPPVRRALFAAARAGVEEAHRAILAAARGDRSRAGMGTTFTGFLVAGGEACFAHAGDSRAYLVRDGAVLQLTEDHTVLAGLRAAGEGGDLTDPGRWAGVLTNALGVGDGLRVATFAVSLYPGDRLVLTSDGVSEHVAPDELAPLIAEGGDPAAQAERMIGRALERGGLDNATAIVVEVAAAAPRLPPARRDADAAVIAGCPLFAGLTAQERLRALRVAGTLALAGGREVPARVAGARAAHLVLSGEVDAGRGRVGPGALIYPAALIGDAPVPTHLARATADARLLALLRPDVDAISEEEPALGIKLFAGLANLLVR